ncbi:MAG: hypothetical protein ABJB74_23445 [Gemmatimonas sp.]
MLVSCATPALLLSINTPIVRAQASVPVRELSAPLASANITFRNIFSVREIAGAKLLVNDGVQRRVVMLDASMANPKVVLDSVSQGTNYYGPRASPLISFLADSTLFIDAPSLSLVVIDPNGKITRVMAAPRPNDLRFLMGSPSHIDSRGNLLYRLEPAHNQLSLTRPTAGTTMIVTQPQDSAPISRANFEKRSIDTVAYVRIYNGVRTTTTRTSDALSTKLLVNPLVTVDEWTVLSDGTIALVRGHDYHVDMIRPDGRALSGAKLPFDWKRLTNVDKQQLIDSARAATNPPQAVPATMPVSRGDSSQSSSSGGPLKVQPTTTEFVPVSEIGDYYPPIRLGAAKADADGNLWILPTTSAQSKAGELVYDVIDNRGTLKERVRVPVGRSIAGFGRGGVVYLMFRDAANEWHLERTKVVGATRP